LNKDLIKVSEPYKIILINFNLLNLLFKQIYFKNLKDTNYYDDKVSQGKEYEYRVSAVNEGGEGDFSNASAPIPAKPEKEKPKFDRSGLHGPFKEIKVKAGEPIEIELPMVGTPSPEVSWIKDDKLPIQNNTNGFL
jgi:hypothetical protein